MNHSSRGSHATRPSVPAGNTCSDYSKKSAPGALRGTSLTENLPEMTPGHSAYSSSLWHILERVRQEEQERKLLAPSLSTWLLRKSVGCRTSEEAQTILQRALFQARASGARCFARGAGGKPIASGTGGGDLGFRKDPSDRGEPNGTCLQQGSVNLDKEGTDLPQGPKETAVTVKGCRSNPLRAKLLSSVFGATK